MKKKLLHPLVVFIVVYSAILSYFLISGYKEIGLFFLVLTGILFSFVGVFQIIVKITIKILTFKPLKPLFSYYIKEYHTFVSNPFIDVLLRISNIPFYLILLGPILIILSLVYFILTRVYFI